jgi:hypothetical protein
MASEIIRNEQKENESKINNFDIKCNYEFESDENCVLKLQSEKSAILLHFMLKKM